MKDHALSGGTVADKVNDALRETIQNRNSCPTLQSIMDMSLLSKGHRIQHPIQGHGTQQEGSFDLLKNFPINLFSPRKLSCPSLFKDIVITHLSQLYFAHLDTSTCR